MKYYLTKEKLSIISDRNWTVSEFLNYFCKSRKDSYLLIQNRQIQINGLPVKSTDISINSNDEITVLLPETEIDYSPSRQECQVVYEDDFVYIAHKPPGLIVHDEEMECLAKQAAAWQKNHGLNSPVRYIHRLDKETTGLVLFVKIPFFKAWFDNQLEERKITRDYLAITYGTAKLNQTLTINKPIASDRHINNKYRISPTGKPAVTIVTPIKQKGKYLLYRCRLKTGRTHQIRVHLSDSNHPIVNDAIYGKSSSDFHHMGLWAYKITFHNPITGEEITVNDIPNPDYAYFAK